MAVKKKQEEVRKEFILKRIYNQFIYILGVLFDNVDFLIGKLFKLSLYALEGIGVYYVLYILTRYRIGLDLIQSGKPEMGKAYIDALINVAQATNNIVLGIAVALPTFMSAMRIAKRRLIN